MTNQYLATNINAPRNPRGTDADLSLNLDDEFVIITANAPQITLPTATQIPSREIYIKSVPGTGSVVGILGQTIDGLASFTFTNANEALLVKSDGTNWLIVVGGVSASGMSLQAAYDGGPLIVTSGNTIDFSGAAGAGGFSVSMVDAVAIGVAAQTAADTSGNALTLTSGDGLGTGSGGAASITAGDSGVGATGNGGAASLIAGAATSTLGAGGAAIITAGASTGATAGGNIVLTSGASVSGTNGFISALSAADQDEALMVFTPSGTAVTVGLHSGTDDPNTVTPATRGSIYMRNTGATGEVWVNTDNATAWTQLGAGAGGGAQIVFGSANVSATTADRFLWAGNRDTPAPTSSTATKLPMTRAGTLQNFYVYHGSGNGNGGDIVYTVHVNGIATAITVTIASTDETVFFDTSNSVVVVRTDNVTVVVTKAVSIGTSPSDVQAGMEYA